MIHRTALLLSMLLVMMLSTVHFCSSRNPSWMTNYYSSVPGLGVSKVSFSEYFYATPTSQLSKHHNFDKKSGYARALVIDLLQQFRPEIVCFVFRDCVMQIQLKCRCGDGQCPEWAIIEFQGVVEVQPPFQDRLQNLEIGKLCRPSSQESYTFTVGYHELTGSKVPLKKPLLVLRKPKLLDPEGRCDADSGTSNVEMQVMGVIRHRILFKTRPKALISRPQQAIREKALGTSSNTKKE